MTNLIIALIPLLIAVESAGNPSAISRDGECWGILQQKAIYVRDVNQHYGTHYRHKDSFDPVRAKEITVKYLTFWGREYERKTGRKPTLEVLSRIHAGGPDGWRQKATLKYWKKVKRRLNHD